MRVRLGRGGFTLVEMTTAVLVMATLAGLALAHLRQAVARADAATVVSDAETVGLAALEALTETGRYPGGGGWGVVPDELRDRLPDGFDFRHADSEYLWFSLSWPRPVLFGSRHVGVFVVRHGTRGMAEAMKLHRGPTVFWMPQYTIFVASG